MSNTRFDTKKMMIRNSSENKKGHHFLLFTTISIERKKKELSVLCLTLVLSLVLIVTWLSIAPLEWVSNKYFLMIIFQRLTFWSGYVKLKAVIIERTLEMFSVILHACFLSKPWTLLFSTSKGNIFLLWQWSYSVPNVNIPFSKT